MKWNLGYLRAGEKSHLEETKGEVEQIIWNRLKYAKSLKDTYKDLES